MEEGGMGWSCSFSRENQHGRYPYSKRMQLTCTAWVESLNTRDDGGGGGHIDHVKNISLYHPSTLCPLAAVC
jgi:hypothetical protein